MSDRAAPDCHLRLEWVYGYKGHQCHNNLFYCGNKVVYFVAGVCIVYDPEKHKQSFYLGHTDDIHCLSLHPNEKWLASAQIGKDPFICVWDSENGQTKSLLQNGHQRGICAVSFSHDGSFLASVGMDDHNTLCIWDWQKGRIIAYNRTHGERVMDVKFNPSNSTQLVTCGLKHIKFWNLCGNTLSSKSGILGKFGPSQSFHSLHFNRSNDVIAGAANGALYRFEKNKASSAQSVHKGAMFCLSGWGSDGYVTGGKDGMVHLLDTDYNVTHSYNLTATEQGYTGLCVKSVFCKDSKILVGTENSEIFELDTKSKDKVRLLVQGHSEGELWALATHPTKASVFATSSDDCTLQQWNLTEHGVVGKKILPEKARSLAYSPDAELLAIGFTDGSFSVVKSKDLSEVHQAQIRKEVIHELKFSPDGAYLAVGSNDNYVDIFSVAQSWKKVGQCSGSSSFITHLDWSQDGKFLQTNSGAAERLVYKMPNGKRITSKDEIDKIVWQTWTGVLGQEVRGIWAKYGDTNDVNALDVNFQQGVCVTGDDFGLVKLFKFPTFKKGSKFKKYVGHSAHVTNVRFTCDLKRVITVGGADHAVFQWKFVPGSEEGSCETPENFELVGGDPVWSDSEASDSEMSNVGELDSDIEHEGELTYDRHFSKEMISEFYKKENLVVSQENVSTGLPVKPKVAPATGLSLEFVFGYRGYDCRNNLFFLSTGEIVYHVAALGIVYDRKKHVQRFYNGHSDDILCLAVHPNKDIAATGQVGKVASVHVWDCVTMKCLSLLRGQMLRGVCTLDFSTQDGGKRLACVSVDDHHTVHIWDWKKGEKVASVRGHKDKILSIKYNPFNSDKLVIVGMKHIKFLTQAGGGLTVKRGTFGSVAKLVTMCCVTYGKGEDVCFSGADTGHVYVWTNNNLQRIVQAHNDGPCFCVSAVSNFEGFITGGKDGRICLWDETFERCLKSYLVEKSESCNIITSSSKTSASLRSVRIGHGVIVAGTRNGEIVEVDKSGQVSVLVQGHAEGELWGLAVNEESDVIATVSDDKTFKLWSVKEKKMLNSHALSQAARCVDFSPNGKFIAVGFKNGSFSVFELKSVENEEIEKIVDVHHRKEEISDIKFSPVTAKYLAVASHDNFVDIYNVHSHKRVGVCKGASSYITHIDWNAEETLLMVNSGAKELLFFEAPRGKRVALRHDVIDSTKWFSFTCVIGSNVEGIWRPRCDVTDVNACCRTRDASLLATGDDFGFVKLFTFPVKGKFAKFKQYPGHSAHVTNVRWTPDNRKLISTGGADAAICIWNNKNSSDLSMREFSEANESKAPSVDIDNQSGDSDVSFGESDEEGYDSDVTREIKIDYEAKIYPSDLSALREKQKTSSIEKGQAEWPRVVSRNVSCGVPKVAANNSKTSKGEISGLELEHVIGYRGFDTRDNLHFVNDNNDIVYHAAAVCIVQNISTGVQKFYREHTDDVLCLTVCQSPKFKNICASGQVGQDPAVFIWDASKMETLSILNNGHSRGVCYLDFSSSGRFLCTVGLDEQHTIILWRWQEPFAVSRQSTGSNRLFCVKFRPDSDSRLVSAGFSYLSFWDVAGSSLIQKKPHIPCGMNYKKQTMLSIAFGPDDLTFTGSVKGDIFVWRKNVLHRVVSKAHKGPVFSLFTTLKDGLIVSSGKDKNVRESPSAIKLWDSEMRRCKAFFLEHADKQTVIKSVSRSGSMILVGSRDSDIFHIEEKRNSCHKLVLGHAEGELCGLATSPSDSCIFASSSDDNTLRLWNFKNLKDSSSVVKLDNGSRCVAFSPDGELLAVGLNNGSFRIYNCFTLQVHAHKRDRGAVILVIAFSPDGKRLAVGAEDASVDIYDVSSSHSLSRVTSCKGIQSKVYIADFSQDASYIKVGTGNYQSLVFDASTGNRVDDVSATETISWNSWTSVLGKEVEGIWPTFGAEIATQGENEFINTAHVSPASVNRIATGDDSGLVKLFPFPCPNDQSINSDSAKDIEGSVMQYPGHSAHVTAVRFTHDDSRLISAGGEDCCLFVWRCV